MGVGPGVRSGLRGSVGWDTQGTTTHAVPTKGAHVVQVDELERAGLCDGLVGIGGRDEGRKAARVTNGTKG